MQPKASEERLPYSYITLAHFNTGGQSSPSGAAKRQDKFIGRFRHIRPDEGSKSTFLHISYGYIQQAQIYAFASDMNQTYIAEAEAYIWTIPIIRSYQPWHQKGMKYSIQKKRKPFSNGAPLPLQPAPENRQNYLHLTAVRQRAFASSRSPLLQTFFLKEAFEALFERQNRDAMERRQEFM